MLLVPWTSSVIAQEAKCAMTDADQNWEMPVVDYALLASTLNATYDIPLHVHMFNEEDGSTPHEEGFELELVQDGVGLANAYFPPQYNFYICKVDYYDFGEYPVSTNPSNEPAVQSYAAAIFDNNAINVYIKRGIGAMGARNIGVKMDPEVAGGEIMVHELGHYFSLQHTDVRTRVFDYPNTMPGCDYLAFTPESICIFDDCDPDQTFCNNSCDGIAEEDYCNCRGDGFCDTNVDPGISFCSPSSETGTPCDVTIGGQVFTYYPDYDNVMSYYDGLDHFSDQQAAAMMQQFLDDYGFLRDDDVPECDDIVDGDFLLPRAGLIERIRFEQGNVAEFDPLPDWRILAGDETFVDLYCISSSNDEGRYEYTYSSFCEELIPDFITEESDILDSKSNGPTFTHDIPVDEGVSTFDIIKISRHILGTDPFDNPYKMIAADVNNSGTITTFDLIKIRKLILNIETEFADVYSFRLLPRHVFTSDPNFEAAFNANPFTAIWSIYGEERSYLGSEDTKSYLDYSTLDLTTQAATDEVNWSFIAIKMGDVNFSANLESVQTPPENDITLVVTRGDDFPIDDCLNPGDKITAAFIIDPSLSDLAGYQLALNFDADKITAEHVYQGSVTEFSLSNFNLNSLEDGEIKTSWINTQEIMAFSVGDNESLFMVDFVVEKEICKGKGTALLTLNKQWSIFFNGDLENAASTIIVEVNANSKKHQLKSAYPNPVFGQTTFEFKMEEAANVSIIIQDQFGGELSYENFLMAGEHSHVFSNLDQLVDGQLNYNIQLGDESYSGILFKF